MFKKIKTFFADMKFRKKLLLSFTLICIIPIIILGAYCYGKTKQLLITQEEYNIKNSLHLATTNTNHKFDVYNNLSNDIAYNNNIIEAINYNYKNYYDMYKSYKDIIDPLFNAMKYFHDDIERITIYTTNNNIAKHGDFVIPIDSIKNESWFNYTDDLYPSKWIYADNRLFNLKKLPYQSKVHKNILYLEVKPEIAFSSFLNLLPQDSDYGLYIVDSNGQTVFSDSHFEDRAKSLTLPQILQLQKGSSYDVKYLIIKDTISHCNFNVYFYIPKSSKLFDATPILFAVFAIIGICIILLFFLIFCLSNVLVNRIELLIQNMRQVKRGDLTVTVKSTSHDEIGELIENFDQMIHRIKVLINEVYKSKIIQKESEMKALQAQINPHFLYNALSLINWKAITIGANDISRMTQLLSTFYRTTLNNGQEIISVEEEIVNTRSYVEIQLNMHNNNFKVSYDISEDILPFSIIKLILQPIVENAIEHGIDHKLTEGPGELKISGKSEGDNIHFVIEDNGAGIAEENLSNILEKGSKGYGLKNVNDRIRIFYGNQYGLTISSKLMVGTKVEITIPKRKCKNQHEDTFRTDNEEGQK